MGEKEDTSRHRLFVYAKASKGGKDAVQTSGTAYAIIVRRGTITHWHWGLGYEPHVAVMAVHAMIRILDEVQLRNINPQLDIITNYPSVLKQGIESMYHQLMQRSLNRKVRSRNKEYSWKQFAQTSELCKVVYSPPATENDLIVRKEAERLAASKARIAADRHIAGDVQEGVLDEDGQSFGWLTVDAS